MTRRLAVLRICAALLAVAILALPSTSGRAVADPTDAPAASAADPAPSVAGLVVYHSNYSVAETVSRVQSQLSSIGKVIATVDFAQTAHWINKEIRPTTLVIGGNPAAGEPLIAAKQRVAIDLPQKYLVWQAAGGTVFLGYNSAEYVAARAGIDSSNDAVDGLRSGSASVAAAASGSAAPLAEGSGGPSGTYLIEKTSDATVADAIGRYQSTFAKNNQPTVATIDDTAAAPTEVTITDDATVSVPLVAAQQTIAIDLPLKFVAWQDDSGGVHVAHPDIRVLASRHQVSGQDDLLDRAAAANNYLTNIAAGGRSS